MNDVVVLIPAYNPSKQLLDLIQELTKNGFQKIIIVNDGSITGKEIFKEIKKNNKCILLEYKNNHGKGYALKYGFNYYLNELTNICKGIVTADADYQHLPIDIMKLAKELNNKPDSLVLGVRNFNDKNVYFLNSIGNKLTSLTFKLLYKIKIVDTQTGLRAINNNDLKLCLEVDGNGFEYEMNMLIKFAKLKKSIKEIQITTVYPKERSSHFKRFKDSFKIYKNLFSNYFK